MTKQTVAATPVEAFANTALRDSVNRALADVPAGHGSAVLDVDNKGAGVMLVHRFDSGWAVLASGRYSFADKGLQVRVAASWE